MLDILSSFFLFIVGATIGSFACCQVWRIRKNDKSKWSHCMHCKYQLQWYDNIPIISWLTLGGKCRKCRKKIGITEFLSEVFTGVVFLTTYLLWPGREALLLGDLWEVSKFVVFLTTISIFVILFIYDAKWKELPTKLLYATMVSGLIYCVLNCLGSGEIDWLMLGGSLMVLPGFYFLMYKISRESWVGGGDWMLCVPLALMLGNFWLGMFALFVSNFLGCAVMLPVIKIKKKKEMIPFGPFLILGFLVVFFMQKMILGLIVY